MQKDHPCRYIAKSLGYQSWSRVLFKIRSGAIFRLKLPKATSAYGFRKERQFQERLIADGVVMVIDVDGVPLIGLRENLPEASVRCNDAVQLILARF